MNLILHLANTLLLFAVLRKMTGALWPSAFVAAAFAIHPMHVESVAWIAERKDVLSTLFLLLTLAAYVSYVKTPRPGSLCADSAAVRIGPSGKTNARYFAVPAPASGLLAAGTNRKTEDGRQKTEGKGRISEGIGRYG